ncbi:hypothetical protein EYF80_024766 [Liparis tanakae]|uniref:Uncharacterized protein n=1 Tax=Liparis tanakae TaxID=230148 RepID=A0A4Z2HGP3_9TELE|nr:hypothetical protein EYF80_024766 [Liparis tanakae]
MVATVVVAPFQAFAYRQLRLVALAVDIVQENSSGSVAKIGVAVCMDGTAAVDLLAHHPGIVEGPVVITHCPPVSLVVDLYPALAGIRPVHQTDADRGALPAARLGSAPRQRQLASISRGRCSPEQHVILFLRVA